MNEAQMNARSAADPSWFMQFALGFMALCLKHYEDVLRDEHEALLAQSRAHADETEKRFFAAPAKGGRSSE